MQYISSSDVVNLEQLLPGLGLFCGWEDYTSLSQTRKNVQKAKTQIKSSQHVHDFIYVGKVKNRADFLDYFGN